MKKSIKPAGFLVVYDDQDCLHIPFAWDRDCEGAICSGGSADGFAVFPSKAEARKAIDISTRFNALLKSQGKPRNEDFESPSRKFIRIVPLFAGKVVK
jgi:hypothetical protein